MRSKRRILVAVIAIATLVAVAGAYFLVTHPAPVLIVPAGTIVNGTAIHSWVAHFVASNRGRVVGAAVAVLPDNVSTSPGYWGVGVALGFVLQPPDPPCPAQTNLPPASESFNVSLSPGSYTLFWALCMTYPPTTITVTQSIELVP